MMYILRLNQDFENPEILEATSLITPGLASPPASGLAVIHARLTRITGDSLECRGKDTDIEGIHVGLRRGSVTPCHLRQEIHVEWGLCPLTTRAVGVDGE